MSDEQDYGSPIVPAGEMSYTIHEGGQITGVPKVDERNSIWKGAGKIAAMPDSSIQEYAPRPSGVVDYRIGNVSVSFRGGRRNGRRQYLCHTHVTNNCPHTKRIQRYREEHPTSAAA